MPTYRSLFVLLFVLMLSGPASAEGLTDLIMSPEDEKRIGAAEHQKILTEFGGAYHDEALTDYVDSIGQFLVTTTATADTEYTFTVLNSPVVNAFALPGGYVYVTRGLVALAENEAELAGVIAHEIGHVVSRHSAKRQTKGTLANIGLLILGAATESSTAVDIGQLGASAILSGYSREDEYEADNLGVQYMSRAGFSPHAMASFLRKLQANDQLQSLLYGRRSSSGFGFFDTHPRTADRVERAIADASALQVSNPIVAQDIYYEKIDGVLYGDDPSEGLIFGRRFVHPDLRFQFTVPQDFHLINTPTAVLARGPSGAGIKLDMDDARTGGDMRRYITDVWAPEVTVRNVRRFKVNGQPAASAVISGIQNGQADAVLAAIYHRKNVYRLAFVVPRAVEGRLNYAVEQTVQSFRSLTAAQAREYRPQSVVVHEVQPGDTIHSLSRRLPFADHQLERFLVLNGMDRNSDLRAGQLVKLIE